MIKVLRGDGDTKVSTSVKWDGAPAIFAGINPDNGKFFVGTKSIFNKDPKINYTLEDIKQNHGHAPGLVDKFDLTYGFLIDETNAEFSYDAYWNQIVEGERAPRTPEQWQRAKNILLGNLEFEAWMIKNDLVNKTDKVSTAAKRNKKAEVPDKAADSFIEKPADEPKKASWLARNVPSIFGKKNK